MRKRTQLLAAALLVATPASGQKIGDRLRVTLEAPQQVVTGLLTGRDAHGLVLADRDGNLHTVPRARIVDTQRGTISHKGQRGAVVGGVIGSGSIVIIAVLFSGVDESTPGFGGSGIDVAAFVQTTLVSGAIGSGIGYLIGRGFKREVWQSVSLPAPSVTFDRGRLAATFTVRH